MELLKYTQTTSDVHTAEDSSEQIPKDVEKNTILEKKIILVIGDSHTRDLNYILNNLAPKNCKISCIVRPGKTLEQIVDEVDIK